MAKSGGQAARVGVGLAVGAVIGLVTLDLDLASLASFWGDRSFLAPLAAVVSAVLWLLPLRRLVALAAVLAAALWLTAAYSPLVRTLANGLVRRDSVPASADAVYVFASRIQSDGEPTGDAMSRLVEGLELVAGGRASRLIVSEQRRSRHYAPIAREWARQFAPKAEVLAVGPIHDTHDEALAVARLCRERGWRRVLAVTSPVHTRRAAAALENAGLEIVSVPCIETRYDIETLDLPGDRRRAFGSVLHERLGLFVYRRRGWID